MDDIKPHYVDPNKVEAFAWVCGECGMFVRWLDSDWVEHEDPQFNLNDEE